MTHRYLIAAEARSQFLNVSVTTGNVASIRSGTKIRELAQ
jgi:hypothetical protein